MQPAKLVESLPQAGQSPRDLAIACCRDMERAFGPERFPVRPLELIDVPRAQLAAMHEKAALGKPLEFTERTLLTLEAEYNVSRATATQGNLARLRGAMWAIVTLKRALREQPDDLEAEQLGGLLVEYVQSVWSVPHWVSAQELERAGVPATIWQQWAAHAEVPEALPMRTALADLHITLLARASSDGGRQPTQAELYA